MHRIEPHHDIGLRGGFPNRSEVIESVAADHRGQVPLSFDFAMDFEVHHESVNTAGKRVNSGIRHIGDENKTHLYPDCSHGTAFDYAQADGMAIPKS
jgi:hypothetical protein